MKRKTAWFLCLLAAILLLPYVSFGGSEIPDAEVTVNGTTYTLRWETININKGKMNVTVSGFGKAKGKDVGWLSVITGGVEKEAKSAKNDGKGNCIYSFESSALPDAILFTPNGGQKILLWKDSSYGIPATYTGIWEGTAAPKDGGTEFALHVILRYDGTGEYSYRTEDSGAKMPFTLEVKDTSFTAVPAGGLLSVTGLKGSFRLRRAVLEADVTAVYSDGGETAYTVKLRKAAEAGEE